MELETLSLLAPPASPLNATLIRQKTCQDASYSTHLQVFRLPCETAGVFAALDYLSCTRRSGVRFIGNSSTSADV